MSTTAEIRSIVLRWEMFVAKYSLPIARTSSKIFYVNLTAVFSQTSPLIV